MRRLISTAALLALATVSAYANAFEIRCSDAEGGLLLKTYWVDEGQQAVGLGGIRAYDVRITSSEIKFVMDYTLTEDTFRISRETGHGTVTRFNSKTGERQVAKHICTKVTRAF
ncbi:hypothetical protein [Noviherbaspirillum malthae]|uniref:hypothetical protein n=1 Tax=Noviherbaspirillum malthae TaxID=1260987 RepID=UPI00188FC778|nr:hypothetical protein [Noviherbaspirillum malthae]